MTLEPWHWLVVGLALLIAELFTGSLYLLWLALAAWLTGVAFLVVPMPIPAQLLLFSISAVTLTFVGRDRFKGRFWRGGAKTALNAPEHDLVGRAATAQADFQSGEGRVALGDTTWRAASTAPVAAGQIVEIKAVEGATLIVAPAAAIDPQTD